jgi:hypothetical protein
MIIHSPIFSGSINQAESAYANLSGSFSGSFTGVGNFVGLEADSVAYENVTGKPTLVSGSSQVSYPNLSNIPSGIVSGSSQVVGILTSLNTYTASNDTTNTTQNSRLDQLSTASGSAITRLTALEVETANLESFTSSINTTIKTRLNAETVISGSSQVVYTSISSIPAGIVSGSAQVTPLLPTGVVSGSSQVVYTSLSSIPGGIVSGSSQVNADSITNFDTNVKDKLNTDSVVSGSSQITYSGISSIPAGIVSGSSQVTPLLPTGTVSGSSQITYTSISSIPAGIVSGSSQVTPLLPSGVVSGSSQVNADSITNFDTNVKDKLNADLVVSGSASSVKTFLSLQNVTNESKATMFSSPTFTGTVSGVTATHVGLGNVTNESKATMFTSPTFTGTPVAPTAPANTNSTQIATTAYVQQELTDLIGGANEAFDTLIEISASLASGDSTLNTLVDGKLAKASNLSDLTDTSAARTNLGVAIGTNVQAYNATLAAVAGGTYSGDDSITTIGTVTAGSVTAILPVGVVSGSGQINVASTTGDIALGTRTSGNYVATITAGNGIVSSGATTGEGVTHTISVGGGVVSGSIQVDHDATTNFVANEHIDHSTVTITAGDGLTGGGTIAATRTLNVVGTAGRITVSADAVDIASTYVGQATITTLGTISTGTWNGSVIASAYLDADTAHLTETQTFSGAKTFSAAVSVTNSTASTTTTTGALLVTGGVGIGGALNVGGDVVAYASSDKRLKDNIKNIENPIQKVQKLNGVTWDWNSNADELQQSLPNVGVIAQEVEEVLPQLVHNRDNGYKGVDYAKLTGLLIEAIKEQQKQIDELKSKLQ